MAQVELRQVEKAFGSVKVIHGVDLVIEEGEFMVFVGPSGSGKSTLLRMIAGLETTTDGTVLIDSDDVTFKEPAERGIAMVFQSYALYPHMNVYNNMAFNLRLSKLPRDEVDARVREAARILRLEDLLDRSPGMLSGGQRQRVAIGRAIVRKPKVFLFDEPLSNLDAALRVQMRLEIERLHRELDATMIYVTHDQIEAMTLADRIAVLDGGSLKQVGSPMDLYKAPANQFVGGFIGSPRMNFFGGTVVDAVDGRARIALTSSPDVIFDVAANGISAGDSLNVGVRPEAIEVFATSEDLPPPWVGLAARVDTMERLGNINFGYFNAGSEDLVTVQIMGETTLAHGNEITLGLPGDKLHLFHADGRALNNPLGA